MIFSGASSKYLIDDSIIRFCTEPSQVWTVESGECLCRLLPCSRLTISLLPPPLLSYCTRPSLPRHIQMAGMALVHIYYLQKSVNPHYLRYLLTITSTMKLTVITIFQKQVFFSLLLGFSNQLFSPRNLFGKLCALLTDIPLILCAITKTTTGSSSY